MLQNLLNEWCSEFRGKTFHFNRAWPEFTPLSLSPKVVKLWNIKKNTYSRCLHSPSKQELFEWKSTNLESLQCWVLCLQGMDSSSWSVGWWAWCHLPLVLLSQGQQTSQSATCFKTTTEKVLCKHLHKEITPSYLGSDFLCLQVCKLDISLFSLSDPGKQVSLILMHTLEMGLN